jgi:formate dehydrogenase accessory protein FdhE
LIVGRNKMNGHWDARLHRASELASIYPFASEGLRFYSSVTTFQKNLYSAIRKVLADSPKMSANRPLRDELDLVFLLAHFSEFLTLLQQIAPEPIARSSADLELMGPAGWQRAIESFWHGDLELEAGQVPAADENFAATADPLLAWMFLQPYAEYLADHREAVIVEGTPATCPICGGKPIVGLLRSEGDGAKKSLICMLCAHEWAFRRIFCPACGEEREPQMAFYSAPEIAHVRVDVCDTCHTYLKTIDLTKLGLAVPVVDELATIPLDLWAREHGYEKLQINMLGI